MIARQHLDLVGTHGLRRPHTHELSGGHEAARRSIARSLRNDPEVAAVMDEPVRRNFDAQTAGERSARRIAPHMAPPRQGPSFFPYARDRRGGGARAAGCGSLKMIPRQRPIQACRRDFSREKADSQRKTEKDVQISCLKFLFPAE